MSPIRSVCCIAAVLTFSFASLAAPPKKFKAAVAKEDWTVKSDFDCTDSQGNAVDHCHLRENDTFKLVELDATPYYLRLTGNFRDADGKQHKVEGIMTWDGEAYTGAVAVEHKNHATQPHWVVLFPENAKLYRINLCDVPEAGRCGDGQHMGSGHAEGG